MIVGDFTSGAVFSEDRTYRQVLWRRFVEGCSTQRMAAFVGLNPSVANEVDSDPTVTRWMNYAKSWGYDGIVVVNAFDLVETDRLAMLKHSKPLSDKNDDAILQAATRCGIVVACWGADGGHRNRSACLKHLLRHVDLYCLKLTKYGQPQHPLYLKKDLKPILWQPALTPPLCLD